MMRPDESTAWIENRPPAGFWPQLDLGELWAFRELALFLALRDLKVRYKQTTFGIAWAVIQPLAGVAIFSVVLGHFAHLSSDHVAYPVFVYAGLAGWTYVSNAVGSAARILVEDRSLVTRIYFPRLLAPLAGVLPDLIDLGISLPIIGVFMAIYGVAPNAAILLLPVWLAAFIGVALGAGMWLSALNVQYRDVRHALPFLLQLWLYASPVVYSASIIHGWLRFVYAANPIVGVFEGFRWSLLGTHAPTAPSLISLAAGVLLLLSGIAYFRFAERRFADVI
jgi:ABC-type polysaccharide/polyol phosphate export permease